MEKISNYASVKELLVTDCTYLKDSVDVERELDEIADSLVPVYDGEIAREWAEMPSEFDNSWVESLGTQHEQRRTYLMLPESMASVTKLMAYDLYSYYRQLVAEVWADLVKESESE